jgi:hypothetical protein
MVVADGTLDKGGEGAVRFLEGRRFDDGDRNLRRVSSNDKCRARGQVRHQVFPKRDRCFRPFEG